MKTRTAEHFGKLIGNKVHRMGVLARLYPQNTLSSLTDMLGNVFMNDSGAKSKLNKYTSIDSNMFEWNVEVNLIKRIPFAIQPTTTGADGAEIEMTFTENYYQLEEIFVIDESHQQCMVVSNPVRKSDNEWSVCVRLMGNDYRSELDTSACMPGMTTHWIGELLADLKQGKNGKFCDENTVLTIWITKGQIEMLSIDSE